MSDHTLDIPDISGFTQFIKTTEISHSKHTYGGGTYAEALAQACEATCKGDLQGRPARAACKEAHCGLIVHGHLLD